MDNKIVIFRNNVIDFPVTITNEDGTPFNLDGYTVKFTAKKNKTDSAEDAAIKTVIGDNSETEGVSVISLSAGATDVTEGEYWYDVQIEKATTTGQPPVTTILDRKTVIMDILVIKQEITT